MSEEWPKPPSKADLPQAYQDGKADFYGRDFLVSPDVLIPRPETEMAVDAVLVLAGKAILPGVNEARSKLPKKPRILDVGTGSGCIAVTLACELPEATVTAVDVSEKALKVAKENAARLGVKVQFVQSDLLSEVEGDFDIIIANLPYVDRNWEWLKESASQGLKYEPELALYAEQGGLAVIFELIEQARGRTQWLVLEADPCQHARIIEYAKPRGWVCHEVRGFQVVLTAS